MSVFQFKKFQVEQKQSAAKITSDATVFASALHPLNPVKRALEIGAGTGFLSLILAQRFSDLEIDAVELNRDAYQEAKMNFENSPWSERLRIENQDFKQYQDAEGYDLIFSNPPFFKNNLQSNINSAKNMAYHTDYLSFEQLASGIHSNLKKEGEVHIMLPTYEMSLLEGFMREIGLIKVKTTALKHNPKTKTIRSFSVFCRKEFTAHLDGMETIYMRDEEGNYHPSYIDLMKDLLIIF